MTNKFFLKFLKLLPNLSKEVVLLMFFALILSETDEVQESSNWKQQIANPEERRLWRYLAYLSVKSFKLFCRSHSLLILNS